MFGCKEYKFYLDISKEDLIHVYQGSIHKLRAKTTSNLVIELDANHLRRFTTRSGIKGWFVLTTTNQNKFISLEKIG